MIDVFATPDVSEREHWLRIRDAICERVEKSLKLSANAERIRDAEAALHLLDLLDHETAEYYRGKREVPVPSVGYRHKVVDSLFGC